MKKNFYIDKLGEKAKIASLSLSNIDNKKRNDVLKQFNKYLKSYSRSILNSNKRDISRRRTYRYSRGEQ